MLNVAIKTLTGNGLPVEAQPWAREVDRFIRDEDARKQMLARTGNQALVAAGTAITTAANSAAAQSYALAQQRRIPATLNTADVELEVSAYFEASGSPSGRIDATVTPSDLDVDGNPLIPVRYQMWGRVFYPDATLEGDRTTIGFGPNYQLLATSPTTNLRADSLQCGVQYQLRFTSVSSFDVPGVLSDWLDATPPATLDAMAPPNPATLATGAGMLVVTWDGLFDVSQPSSQFRHVYALVSVAGENAWERMGSALVRGGGSIQISGLTVGDDYDVTLVAVDSLDGETAPSAVRTIALLGVEQAHLSPELTTAISAAGGNTVTSSLTAPDVDGTAIGDVWFQHGSTNNVIAQWHWGAAGWVEQTLSHEVISSVDLGTATVGTLHGDYITARTLKANAFEAGTITANELSPTIGDSLDISANESVNIIIGRQDATDVTADELAGSLSQTQDRFHFGEDGLLISESTGSMSLALRSGQIEILNNGAPQSTWTDGQMEVDSFIGRQLVLGAHKLERRVDDAGNDLPETIVRAL
jgi:uncharacterized protein YqkB